MTKLTTAAPIWSRRSQDGDVFEKVTKISDEWLTNGLPSTFSTVSQQLAALTVEKVRHSRRSVAAARQAWRAITWPAHFFGWVATKPDKVVVHRACARRRLSCASQRRRSVAHCSSANALPRCIGRAGGPRGPTWPLLAALRLEDLSPDGFAAPPHADRSMGLGGVGRVTSSVSAITSASSAARTSVNSAAAPRTSGHRKPSSRERCAGEPEVDQIVEFYVQVRAA